MDRIKTIILIVFLVFGAGVLAQAQTPTSSGADLGTALQDFSKLSDGNKDSILNSMGLSGAKGWNWANVLANIIFSSVGFVAFVYGKKNAFWRPMGIGLVLMGYSYFVSETWVVYLVGVALTAALYFWRE
jgi:hypothetical protein